VAQWEAEEIEFSIMRMVRLQIVIVLCSLHLDDDAPTSSPHWHTDTRTLARHWATLDTVHIHSGKIRANANTGAA
jgi:hypothetical protein